MESVLSWIAVAIGAAGMLLGILFGDGKGFCQGRRGWTTTLISLIATIALFAVTFLRQEPFAYGERLGYGILIGGFLGAVAGLHGTRSWTDSLAAAAILSAALLGVGLTLLIYPSYPQPAIGGFMIGVLASAIVFRLALGVRSMEVFALCATVLSTTVMLAIFRFGITADRFWWRAPLMVFATVIVAQIIVGSNKTGERNSATTALLTSLIVFAAIAVFSWKVFPERPIFFVSLFGIGTFAIVAWLSSAASTYSYGPAVSTLAIVAFSAVGFRLMAGFGIGMGLVAAFAVALPLFATLGKESEQNSKEDSVLTRALITAMFIGVGVLCYRLFQENYGTQLRGLDLRDHYTFVALTLGAVFPLVISSLFPVAEKRSEVLQNVTAIATGIFAVVVAAAIIVLWGYKAAFGFVVGSVASEVFILFIQTGAVNTREQRFGESLLLVTAAQIVLLQFAGLLNDAVETTRVTKVIVLACLAVAGLIWAGIAARLQRGNPKEA